MPIATAIGASVNVVLCSNSRMPSARRGARGGSTGATSGRRARPIADTLIPLYGDLLTRNDPTFPSGPTGRSHRDCPLRWAAGQVLLVRSCAAIARTGDCESSAPQASGGRERGVGRARRDAPDPITRAGGVSLGVHAAGGRWRNPRRGWVEQPSRVPGTSLPGANRPRLFGGPENGVESPPSPDRSATPIMRCDRRPVCRSADAMNVSENTLSESAQATAMWSHSVVGRRACHLRVTPTFDNALTRW